MLGIGGNVLLLAVFAVAIVVVLKRTARLSSRSREDLSGGGRQPRRLEDD